MSRHPVRGAYDYARDDIMCPNCRAEPFVWCLYPDGTERRTPCVARLQKRPDPHGPDHLEENR